MMNKVFLLLTCLAAQGLNASQVTQTKTSNKDITTRGIYKMIQEYQTQHSDSFNYYAYYQKIHEEVSPYFVEKSRLIPIMMQIDALKGLIAERKPEDALIPALKEELASQKTYFEKVRKEGTYEGPD